MRSSAAGINQNHSLVTDDDSGVNHGALIVVICMLDRAEKSEHPIVDLDGPWLVKCLCASHAVRNQHCDQTKKGFHFNLRLGNRPTNLSL